MRLPWPARGARSAGLAAAADLAGIAPPAIQVGTRDVLLDDAARLVERARAAGVEVSCRQASLPTVSASFCRRSPLHNRPLYDGVLLLAGPTCSGKTALGLELAERFGAEIVGADSRQIYRGMPIGTAAPTAADRARVPHHLVGFLDPQERYSAARFTHDALAAIASLAARGRRAIVVGGTGFYLRALAGDVALSPAFDEALRARLAREVLLHPPEVMHAWLAARAPERAAQLAPGDRYRVARALEIVLSEGLGDGKASPPTLRSQGAPVLKLVLEVPQASLQERIAARVDAMLAAGFVDEAERIGASAVASDAVGYPHALAYLAGASTPVELRGLLARATRRYAKRQATWFRSEPHARAIAPADAAGVVRAELGW